MADAEAEAKVLTWAEVEAEAEAIQEELSSVRKELKHLNMMMSANISEADKARAKEERSHWIQENIRLNSRLRSVYSNPRDFSGMSEAERAAEAERRRDKALQKARRVQTEGYPMGRNQEALARILDFDPKQQGQYYNRFPFAVNQAAFDLDEESPIGPMRFTGGIYSSNCILSDAVNIFSVKIACSDVGFPIHVYGTVIARDSTDAKCLYLFRRDSEHCQLINSEHESLILTGPKRGLALLDYNYIETDLKIKDHLGQDRELSKGLLRIRGRAGRSLKKGVVETESLATRLSTVDVMYAAVGSAVEATIAVEVLQGDFYGKITAYTTSIRDRFVLYDSEVAAVMTADDCGLIQLMRPVVSVCIHDKLVILFKTGDGKSRKIYFTPRVSSGEKSRIYVGATRMRVKVAWSVMGPC